MLKWSKVQIYSAEGEYCKDFYGKVILLILLITGFKLNSNI